MNLITKSDVKKFIELLKGGLTSGTKKEMSVYTSASTYDGTGVPKEYYVSIEFKFMCDPQMIEDIQNKDAFDNELKDFISKL